MKILFLFFFFYSKFFWLHFTEIVLNNYEAENIIFLRKQSWKYNGGLIYFFSNDFRNIIFTTFRYFMQIFIPFWAKWIEPQNMRWHHLKNTKGYCWEYAQQNKIAKFHSSCDSLYLSFSLTNTIQVDSFFVVWLTKKSPRNKGLAGKKFGTEGHLI